MRNNRALAGVVFALTSSTLYGITPVFVHMAYDRGADPFGLMTARYAISVVVLLAVRFARVGMRNWPDRKTSVQLFLLGALGLYLNGVCVFSAMKRMDSGLMMVIFYHYPIVVVFLGWLFYGQRPARVIWPCLVATIGGVALTASDVSSAQSSGVLIILAGALVYSVYQVIGARVMPRTDLLTGLWMVFAGAGFSFATMWLLDPPGIESTMPANTIAWMAAAEIAVVGTVMAMGAFFAGMKRIGASNSAVIQTFEVIVTIGMGIAFL
ncbi:MAG: DMT family transporter, partial [Actinobacteria bacterium]|nr:DMT family transporter [Actinomycetota bacterium]